MANKLFKSNADALALKDPDTGNVHYVGNFAGDFATNMPGITLASGDTYSDASTGKTYDYLGASIGEYLPAGTVNHTLRHDGTDWVSTAALQVATGATGTVTAAGDMVVSGSTASTTKDTGALVLANGGLGVELAINAGTTITAGTNLVATAGSVSAGTSVSATTTVTAGTNLVATGVLDVNGTGVSDIAGDLTVQGDITTGSAGDAGSLTVTDGTLTATLANGTSNNQLTLGTYVAPSADPHLAPKKYVDDQVSAVATSMTWKGNATVITDTLVVRDLSGNSHTLVATNDLSGALSSLVTADQWWFEGDDDVLRGVGVAGDLVNGSSTVTNTNTTGLTVGMYVSNNNGYIPNSTTIATIVSGTSFTMSANATATSVGALQTFYDSSQISVDLNGNAHTVTYGVQMPVSGYILNTSGTDNYFVVTASVLGTAITAVAGFAFGVIKDLIQPIHAEESAAIYVANTSNSWVKIGEFLIGQIQDGSTNNTLPVWDTADSVWKQNSGLTLSGTAITGTAATALSLTAANNQEINLNASGATGHITIMSAAGDTYVSGVTSAAIGIDGIDANLAFSSAGAAQLRAQTGQNSLLRADANRTVMYNSTTTDVQTTGSPITAGSSPIVDTNFIREKVVMRKTGTTSVALTTGVPAAKFLVSVIGNTAAERYASEIMATSTNATTGVDSVEYSIVSGTTPAALSIAATAASGNVILTVTQTAGTIVVEAIPLV